MLPLLSQNLISLEGGWEFARANEGSIPSTFVGPCSRSTTAGMLDQLGLWSLENGPSIDFDAEHVWFRREIGVLSPGPYWLELLGVATIFDVLWNGEVVDSGTNMFVGHRIAVTAQAGTNTLEIRCRSLSEWFTQIRAPRQRWRTKIVSEAKLRSVRTTLFGRIPSWSPPVPPVGPYLPVRLSPASTETWIVESLTSGIVDGMGRVAITVRSGDTSDATDEKATSTATVPRLQLRVGTTTTGLLPSDDGTWSAKVEISNPQLWWPHTHGDPALYPVDLICESDASGQTLITTHSLGSTGFRSIAVDRGSDGKGFAIRVNDVPVFVRGGSFMPDTTTFGANSAKVVQQLSALAAAGCNMVRVSGVTGYQSDDFFAMCDALGMLVWHDAAFANFDYGLDEVLTNSISEEIGQFLHRTAARPSLAVFCGGSEMEQQATMVGQPPTVAQTTLGATLIRDLIKTHRAELSYVDNSPTGGHLPFANDVGVAHYFGVGAYRRPLADARHANVRFAAECLAFANVPSARVVQKLVGDGESAPVHPRYRNRVPRDRGTGWDFDDVRDYYANILFGVVPSEIRATDPSRYLAIARATSYELYQRTLAEWRRPESSCNGALVWFLNDLWAGPGWGLLDSNGSPKAAYFGFAQAARPLALLAVDEGLNGLDFWLHNDTPNEVTGTLTIRSFRDGLTETDRGHGDVSVSPCSSIRVRADDYFGHFTDPTYAYRFGPAPHHVVVAEWTDAYGGIAGRSAFVPQGLPLTTDSALTITGTATWSPYDKLFLRLKSNRFAQFVTIDAGESSTSDDHFFLVPNEEYVVQVCRSSSGTFPSRIFVSALNGTGEAEIRVPPNGVQP